MFVAFMKSGIPISRIILIMAFIGTVLPAASAAPPCCPVFEDYPGYYYPVDPYYMFPVYCSCPFLDDALARWEEWDIPDSYWEYIIDSQSTCTTCGSGSSTYSAFSYSNIPLIIPEKNAVIAEYDKISVSFSIISKDQALAKYRS